jgi:hypothetical protein
VDPPEEGCCEHHKKDYKPPPDVVDPGPLVDPGRIYVLPFVLPPLSNKNFGLPQNPGYALPPENSFSGSSPSFGLPGEVTPEPLEYFEREEGDFKLPKFKYEEVFDTLMEKFKDKLPIDFVDSFKNASAGSFQLKFTIDFSLPQPFNVRIGPHNIDVGGYIAEFAGTSFSNTIRLILLCCVCIYFIVSVLGIIFS